MGTIISIVVYLVVAAVVLMIVSRLNLGLEVGGFVNAIIAAAVIAIVAGVIYWLLGVLGIKFGADWLGALLNLIVAAVVLLVADRFLPGMKVNGFVGAIIAAVAIGVVGWIIIWLLGLFGIHVQPVIA